MRNKKWVIHLKIRHNPYFSRRFFAIGKEQKKTQRETGHNPYFSRRFFAIREWLSMSENKNRSQSLF